VCQQQIPYSALDYIFVQNLKSGFEVSSDKRRIYLAAIVSGLGDNFHNSVTYSMEQSPS